MVSSINFGLKYAIRADGHVLDERLPKELVKLAGVPADYGIDTMSHEGKIVIYTGREDVDEFKRVGYNEDGITHTLSWDSVINLLREGAFFVYNGARTEKNSIEVQKAQKELAGILSE